MPDAQQPPSSSLHSVLLFVVWQESPSPLLTELIKKLILLPKCRCFKRTFDLEHEDLLCQLMAHGWLTPPELSSTVAGPCFCLLVHNCRAALYGGPFSEVLLTEGLLLGLEVCLVPVFTALARLCPGARDAQGRRAKCERCVLSVR